MKLLKKRILTMLFTGLFLLSLFWQNPVLKAEAVSNVSVQYSSHVQSYGWQSRVADGNISGTSNQKKRLEGIRVWISGNPNLGVRYTTHCQSYGWLPWVSNGEMSGTEGEAKRLEAIKLQLIGSDAAKYDIYYRVHAQNYGWMGWVKNGQSAGTAGYSKRLEAIQIVVQPKGTNPPNVLAGIISNNNLGYIQQTGTEDPVVPGEASTNVRYRTHVQSYSWQGWKSNGAVSGTSGQAKRLEAIRIELNNKQYDGGIRYKTHVQSYGWQDWVANGELSGTSGEAKRLEAIQIELTGQMAEHYDIYYRVHAQSYGWMGWAKNGESAGTSNGSKRLEAIQIVLTEKNGNAPGNLGGIASANGNGYINITNPPTSGSTGTPGGTTPHQPTTGEKNALARAKRYLNSSSFSKSGLIKQLEYEKFTHEQAVYAVDHCGADWNEQALKKAQSYLKSSSFSETGLTKQLEYEEFTHEQAVYAVERCGADWNEQAVKKAASYLKSSPSFSRSRLIEQLEYEGFTHEQAVYGVTQNGL